MNAFVLNSPIVKFCLQHFVEVAFCSFFLSVGLAPWQRNAFFVTIFALENSGASILLLVGSPSTVHGDKREKTSPWTVLPTRNLPASLLQSWFVICACILTIHRTHSHAFFFSSIFSFFNNCFDASH